MQNKATTLAGNALLTFIITVESLAVALYALPYTNVGKASAVSTLASNPTLEILRNRAYWPIAVSLYLMQRNETQDLVRKERIRWALFLLLFLKRSHDRIAGSDIGMLKLADSIAEERAFLDFKPPSRRTIRWMTRAYRACFQPVFIGEENLPVARSKPMIFVSNHSILGFEYPVLLSHLYDTKGIFLRVLADHAHFQTPITSNFLRDSFGAVDGTRRNVDLLMARHEAIFVFPGGARETFKRTTDERYALFWEGKTGFAAMAIRWGAVIIPITNYGTEHMVKVVGDLPLGWLPIPYIYGSDRTLPLIAPQQLQKIYFHIGKPIETEQFKGDFENAENVLSIKNQAQAAIQDGLKLLAARRLIDYPDGDSDSTEVADSLSKYIRSLIGARL
jgi:1-acyl-sn-glycerol-3-phosphate acyltransferase